MAISVLDDMQREHVFPHPPRRIVSLVPSDTHSIWAIGAAENLVGCTEYCEEPVGLMGTLTVVGGTKNVDVEKVLSLAPDLVIANKEENTRSQLGDLSARGVRVFVSFPRRVADGVAHLARLAKILGVQKYPGVVSLVRKGYELIEKKTPGEIRTFAPIWMDPLMTMSGGTYGSDVIAWAGGRNVFFGRERRYPLAADIGTKKPLSEEEVGERDTRYPRITLEEVIAANPARVLLPSEPHAFSAKDADVFRNLEIDAARDNKITFCDGKDLLWYGAWCVEGVPRIRKLLQS